MPGAQAGWGLVPRPTVACRPFSMGWSSSQGSLLGPIVTGVGPTPFWTHSRSPCRGGPLIEDRMGIRQRDIRTFRLELPGPDRHRSEAYWEVSLPGPWAEGAVTLKRLQLHEPWAP